MADKKRRKNSPDREPRQKQPVLPLAVWAVAALLALAAAAVFLHPPTRGKAASALSKTRHIIDILKEDSAKASGARGAPSYSTAASDAALKAIVDKFDELELRDADYTIRYILKDSAVISIDAAVPRGRPMEWVVWSLSSAPAAPYRVEDCVCAAEANCAITFKSANAKHPKIIIKVQQSGRYMSNSAKLAVLIENLGFEVNAVTTEYLSFKEPLTVALLPDGKLAARTAQIAVENKKEVVLLLPMEPLPPQYDKYRESMVMIHHTDENVRGIIARAADAVPNFSGVCGFYGGKVMEDSEALRRVLTEVERRKAYFVYTVDASKKSVASQVAKSMKIRSAPVQPSASIDASATAEQAREKLRRYSIVAQNTGKALIKAQPSPAFIKALKEETDALKRNGIKLVYVSELWK